MNYWKELFLCVQVMVKIINCAEPSIFGNQNSLYAVFNDSKDALEAENKCSSMTGYLAIINSNQVKDKFIAILKSNYPSDLQRVWIFYNPRNRFQYRYQQYSIPSEGMLSVEQRGEIGHFDLYTTATNRIQVSFCRYSADQKIWRVQTNRSCAFSTSWPFQYKFFSFVQAARHGQIVYHYGISTQYSTKLSFSNLTSYPYYERLTPIYAAPASDLLFGARFNKTTSVWKWSDGSVASFSIPQNTSGKDCLQKILEHRSGTFLDRNCAGFKAPYACEFKLMVFAETLPCSESSIKLTWTQSFSAFVNLGKSRLRSFKVSISTSGNNVLTTNLNYTSAKTTVRGLLPEINYRVQMTATFGEFSSHVVESRTNITIPKLNPPAPVNTANVSSVSGCAINIPVHPSNQTLLYQIFAFDYNKNQTAVYNLTLDPYSSHRIFLPEVQRPTTFKIAVISCQRSTNLSLVRGMCSPPIRQQNPETGFLIGTASSAAAVALIVAILIVFLIRRRSAKKRVSNEDATNKIEPTTTASQGKEKEILVAGYGNLRSGGTRANQGKDFPLYANIGAAEISQEPATSTIHKKNLQKVFVAKMKNKHALFTEEFQKIQESSKAIVSSHSTAHRPENTSKNRYKNIYPYDEHRVLVERRGQTDYINASYISGYNYPKKFIATQGPKISTIADFWHMVWEQQSTIIIMLTKEEENRKKKCERYWPDIGSKKNQIEDFMLTTTEEKFLEGIIQRKISVQRGEVCREVTQFHYISWPDHGIPPSTTKMFYLRKMVENLSERKGPIIVHCSAGSGRTGTYIAMDVLCDQLDSEGKVDVKKCVKEMRLCRKEMVQTAEQYAFIHRLILEHAELPDTDRTANELISFTPEKTEEIAQHELFLLANVNAWNKSRGNKSVVRLRQSFQEVVTKMKAFNVEISHVADRCIMAESPGVEQEDKFWEMVVQQQTEFIVSLEGKNDILSVSHGAAKTCTENILLEVSSVKKMDNYTVRKINLTSKDSKQKLATCTQLQVFGWENKPPAEQETIKLIAELQNWVPENLKTILIYHNKGDGKAGVLVALINLLERLEARKRIDVFRTVKDLQEVNPNMNLTAELYDYCYKVTLTQLAAYGTYVNF